MTYLGSIKIEGLEDLEEMFDKFLPEEAHKLNRAATHGVAGELVKRARSKAPFDTGRLRRAIKSHRFKETQKNKVMSGVFVTTARNAKNRAWYWRYVEFGTHKTPAKPFFSPAIQEIRTEIVAIYKEQFYKKLTQKIKRDAKKRLK